MKNKKLKEKLKEKIKDWNEDDENTRIVTWNDIGWVYEIIKDWTGILFSWYVFTLDDDVPTIEFTFYNKKQKYFIIFEIDFETKTANVYSPDLLLTKDFDFTDRENQNMVYKQIKKFLYGEK